MAAGNEEHQVAVRAGVLGGGVILVAGLFVTAGRAGVVFAVSKSTRPAIIQHTSETVGNICRGW